MKHVPSNLTNLRSKKDKLDVDKLVLVPVDFSKLSDIVKNDVVRKDVYNAKIKNIGDKIPDITNLATNNILNAKVNEIKNEIPSINNLVVNASFNAKTNEVKNEISSITNLATTTALILFKIKYLTIVNISLLQHLIS